MTEDPELKKIMSQIDRLEEILDGYTAIVSEMDQYRQVFAATKTGLWTWNAKQKKLIIDKISSQLLNFRPKSDTNQETRWSEILGNTESEKIEHALSETHRKHDTHFEYIIKNEQRISGKSLLLKGGAAAKSDSISGIITEFMSGDIPSGQSNYDITISNLPLGVVTLDKKGKIVSVNPAFLKIFGIKSEEIILTEHITSLVPIKESGIEHYFTTLCEKNIDFDFESPEIMNYADEQFFLHCRGFKLPGSETAYTLLFSDITKRKKLEEQFVQYQRLESIGKLAGGIAHDFNNLLTVIKGASALALREMDDHDKSYQNINQIHRAAERAESLTQQLLAFSRRQLMQPKIINLNALITGLEHQIKANVNDQIQIKYFLSDKTGRIKTDPHQVEQIIRNLVLNASDAMPDGGIMTIETKNEDLDENYLQRRPLVNPGRYVMLAISDSGKGMDKDTQAHIFEPFFTTKEKGRGTGMGLSTVYGIVKQSNGYVWVYSEPGKGTTVKIYLPFYEERIEAGRKQSISDHRLRGNETILVVDDEEEVRNLVSEMLRFYGYNVLEAPNASNALLIFEKYNESIDLVLSDIVMPRMNGMEMIEKILPDYPDTKVIFMSGYTDNMISESEMLDKELNFLQKPFNARSLVEKVREILDT